MRRLSKSRMKRMCLCRRSHRSQFLSRNPTRRRNRRRNPREPSSNGQTNPASPKAPTAKPKAKPPSPTAKPRPTLPPLRRRSRVRGNPKARKKSTSRFKNSTKSPKRPSSQIKRLIESWKNTELRCLKHLVAKVSNNSVFNNF